MPAWYQVKIESRVRARVQVQNPREKIQHSSWKKTWKETSTNKLCQDLFSYFNDTTSDWQIQDCRTKHLTHCCFLQTCIGRIFEHWRSPLAQQERILFQAVQLAVHWVEAACSFFSKRESINLKWYFDTPSPSPPHEFSTLEIPGVTLPALLGCGW